MRPPSREASAGRTEPRALWCLRHGAGFRPMGVTIPGGGSHAGGRAGMLVMLPIDSAAAGAAQRRSAALGRLMAGTHLWCEHHGMLDGTCRWHFVSAVQSVG